MTCITYHIILFFKLALFCQTRINKFWLSYVDQMIVMFHKRTFYWLYAFICSFSSSFTRAFLIVTTRLLPLIFHGISYRFVRLQSYASTFSFFLETIRLDRGLIGNHSGKRWVNYKYIERTCESPLYRNGLQFFLNRSFIIKSHERIT